MTILKYEENIRNDKFYQHYCYIADKAIKIIKTILLEFYSLKKFKLKEETLMDIKNKDKYNSL